MGLLKIKMEFLKLVIIDSHGNYWVGVVDDMQSDVCVYGLKDKDGNPIPQLESEAYHLESFCKTYGLKFFDILCHYNRFYSSETDKLI